MGECSDGMSSSKRRKVERYNNEMSASPDNENDIFYQFFYQFEKYDEFMMTFKNILSGPESCLLPTIIEYCDAASSSSFDECRCIGTPDTDRQFPFGAFFLQGVLIYNHLVDKEMPNNEVLLKVAEKLLKFILDTDFHDELKKIGDEEYVRGKTQVMTTLAEHYYSKLALPQGYVMDRALCNKNICQCGGCKRVNIHFDDTSVGNKKVWHGSLDILMDSCEVPIAIAMEEEEERKDNSRVCSMEETQSENIDATRNRSQVLAQTIVYSMLQKKRHPESRHFLVPSLITNANTLKIFFYDGKNDILLESKRFKYLWPSTTSKMQISLVFETVIASWLVLNYKILCTGPYRECLESAPVSRFKEFAGPKRQIYEDELQFRNVKKNPQVKTFSSWERFRYLKSFEWPSSLPVEPN